MDSQNLPIPTPLPQPALLKNGSGSFSEAHARDLARCSTESARKLLSFTAAFQYCALPLALLEEGDGNQTLLIALERGVSGEVQKTIQFLTGFNLISEEASRENLLRAIHRAYLGDGRQIRESLERIESEEKVSKVQNVVPNKKETNDAPIPSLLSDLLQQSIALESSDIHIEPTDLAYRVRYRIDGILREEKSIQISMQAAKSLSRRIRVLSQCDITETGEPQEGSFSFDTGSWNVRIRVSLIPQARGEKIALRILDIPVSNASELSGTDLFTHLGVRGNHLRLLLAYLGSGSGSILLSGPTGSGKSTLLCHALRYLNHPSRNIMTLEDPVERFISGISQTELSSQKSLGYGELLKALLRQDPDVIMIGEMRDMATAQTALTAGITGHLVLSTVHASNCLDTFSRLFGLGVDAELIASSVRLLVSQRLIPKSCTFCMEKVAQTEEIKRVFFLSEEHILRASRGCGHCRETGTSGRVPVYEMFPVVEAVRNILLASSGDIGKCRQSLQTYAHQTGFRSFVSEVREFLCSGVISPEQALRAIGVAPELVGYSS